ncbi:hypothetical protein GDO81_015716 [Engystomops pustulosus]|uniref:Uncharacterized protein n=1 Tax=Engystomops pustulosus TaxID=76066 RepID=A0AAV7AUM6_ENGPU|nr:hypothetical protein GDO81_015716 [Engystomops pustulosus]
MHESVTCRTLSLDAWLLLQIGTIHYQLQTVLRMAPEPKHEKKENITKVNHLSHVPRKNFYRQVTQKWLNMI